MNILDENDIEFVSDIYLNRLTTNREEAIKTLGSYISDNFNIKPKKAFSCANNWSKDACYPLSMHPLDKDKNFKSLINKLDAMLMNAIQQETQLMAKEEFNKSLNFCKILESDFEEYTKEHTLIENSNECFRWHIEYADGVSGICSLESRIDDPTYWVISFQIFLGTTDDLDINDFQKILHTQNILFRQYMSILILGSEDGTSEQKVLTACYKCGRDVYKKGDMAPAINDLINAIDNFMPDDVIGKLKKYH